MALLKVVSSNLMHTQEVVNIPLTMKLTAVLQLTLAETRGGPQQDLTHTTTSKRTCAN